MRKQVRDLAGEVIPHNIDAERSVLGAILLDNRILNSTIGKIKADDFFLDQHRRIYSRMVDLSEANKSIDFVTLSDHLSSMGELEAAGGGAYLTQLIDGVPRAGHAEHYAKIVRDKAHLRTLIHWAQTIQTKALEAASGEETVSELINGLVDTLSEIARGAQDKAHTKSRSEAADSLISGMETSSSQVRIYMDIPKIDQATGGFRGGELIILTAETGVGKSFMALQINRRACDDGHHCMYASGEMLAEHLMGRVVAADAGVPYAKIRSPELMDSADRRALMESSGRQCKICQILDGELTIPSILSASKVMAAAGNLGCIIVDYDELVEVKGKDEWDQQRILVRELKRMAMELNVPCIEVSQLRKSLDPQDQKRPTLSRLYGSGAKAKHASIVIHVDRPYVRNLKGDECEAHIFILKSRDGRLGKVDCDFNLRTFRFEPKRDEQQEIQLP